MRVEGRAGEEARQRGTEEESGRGPSQTPPPLLLSCGARLQADMQQSSPLLRRSFPACVLGQNAPVPGRSALCREEAPAVALSRQTGSEVQSAAYRPRYHAHRHYELIAASTEAGRHVLPCLNYASSRQTWQECVMRQEEVNQMKPHHEKVRSEAARDGEVCNPA